MSERRGDHERRDEELGAALRALEVPPAGPDFYPTLLARLQGEAEEMRRTRERRRWGLPRLTVPIAAAVAAAVIVSWIVLPGGGRLGPFKFGPRPASAVTADEVRAKVQDAVTGVANLAGEATVVQGSMVTEIMQRFRFVISSGGDFRVTDLDGRSDLSYSARLGVQRSYTADATGRTFLAAEARGLATGPPDPAPEATVVSREVGALVRAFLGTDADVPVEEETYEGRPVWRLIVPVTRSRSGPSGFEPIDREELDVAVDQETGFPLRTTDRRLRADGTVLTYSEVRLSKLRADQTPAPDAFLLEFPAGSGPVTTLDHGFQRTALRDVKGIVGYEPRVPAEVPDGFKLSEVAVARQAGSTAERRNPPSRDVVSLAFQRGFDRFVVTTRSTGPDRGAWIDPLLEASPEPVTAERLVPSSGALRGGEGQIVTGSSSGPHVWVVNDRFVVTVAGDLSPDEMVAVVESMK